MLVLHGTYFWWRKIVAYRNDYCLTCAAERVAFQHRTFYVHHIFWVPVLPLGWWKRWHCSECGSDPHANPRTRRGFKWAGVAVLALISVSGWAVSVQEQPDDVAFIWGLRLGAPVATIWALWSTLKSPEDVKLRERLRAVRPIEDATCPRCNVMLVPGEAAWRCPLCGISRTALPAV